MRVEKKVPASNPRRISSNVAKRCRWMSPSLSALMKRVKTWTGEGSMKAGSLKSRTSNCQVSNPRAIEAKKNSQRLRVKWVLGRLTDCPGDNGSLSFDLPFILTGFNHKLLILVTKRHTIYR